MKFFLILVLFLPNDLFAQSLLKGRVKDLKHMESMAHVNVYFKKSSMGSTTHEDGTFEFLLPPDWEQDTLIFSHIGYQDFKIALRQIDLSQFVSVALEEKDISFPTLVVTPLKIEKILRQSIARLDENHWQTNVELKGFLKVVARSDGKIQQMLYSDMVLSADKKGALDLSFLNPSFKKAAPSDIPLLDAMTTELLLDNLNLKKYLSLWAAKLSKFDSTSVRNTTFSDYAVYELNLMKIVAPQKKYQVKLFIEQETKAIIAIQLYGDKMEPKNVAETEAGRLSRTYRSSAGAIHYRPYKEKWILSEVKAELTSDCELVRAKSQGISAFVHSVGVEMGISECLNAGTLKLETQRIRPNKDIFSQVELLYTKKMEQTPHLTPTELQFLNQN